MFINRSIDRTDMTKTNCNDGMDDMHKQWMKEFYYCVKTQYSQANENPRNINNVELAQLKKELLTHIAICGEFEESPYCNFYRRKFVRCLRDLLIE